MKDDVKITILKRTINDDYINEYGEPEKWAVCSKFDDGQEFISSDGIQMPQGFCSWAWGDIQKIALTLGLGGNFINTKPGLFISCCSDGFRPVFFKLERINERE